MRRRLTVLTVGCKANFADSASIAGSAAEAGFDVVSPRENADVIVVNGCAVTHRADKDSRALVRRARRRFPGATIVMTGCHAEITSREESGLPEADHWIGLRNPGAMEILLKRLGEDAERKPGVPLGEFRADLLLGHRRTYLKIQDGCDSGCTYCIVPLARGRNRSFPEPDILARARRAEEDGARELVLTGAHIGLYGKDRGEDALAVLLARILAATSEARIRLSSLEPGEISDRLLDLCAEDPRVCPHLHIPLQSGCDRTLERMGRPYGSRRYARVVSRAAERIPDLRIGTDVIAGFPGETAADFEETVRFLGDVPVHYMHAFPYSARKGTKSAGWADDVCAKEKKERVSRLIRLDRAKREAYCGEQSGRVLNVLAESVLPGSKEITGYSANYLPVVSTGGEADIGRIVRVLATSVRGGVIVGRRVGPHD
jgi:threonylcarbamoyladenosine tRNA methylthiotransferase MtaB